LAIEKRYWFGRKRIGLGWGPRRWEGWLTVIVYALLMVTLPSYLAAWWGDTGVRVLWLGLTVAFLVIFFWKLERSGSR